GFVLLAAGGPRRLGGPAEDGYDLWLRYRPVGDTARLAEYRTAITQLVVASGGATMGAARDELVTGLRGLLGRDIPVGRAPSRDGALVVGTPASSGVVAALPLGAALRQAGPEGFVIRALPIRGRRAIGGLSTADPLDAAVRGWWAAKADEIYRAIPDFGGFLVKANSEGQPGPQDYHRTHADGANLLADAVAPHGGIVMWRAFVYSSAVPTDRVMQAGDEFVPLDGAFRKNVLLQVKNGPLDFQPREP